MHPVFIEYPYAFSYGHGRRHHYFQLYHCVHRWFCNFHVPDCVDTPLSSMGVYDNFALTVIHTPICPTGDKGTVAVIQTDDQSDVTSLLTAYQHNDIALWPESSVPLLLLTCSNTT